MADLGVGQVVDYRSTAVEDVVRDVDLVLDLIGGETGLLSVSTLRPGRVSADLAAAATAATASGLRMTGILVEPDGAGLSALAGLVDAGQLRVVVEDTLALPDASKSHEVGERGA